MKKKILTLLVLLMTAVSGAWAGEETLLTTVTPTGEGTYSETTAGAVTVTPAGSFFYANSSYGWRWDSYGSLTVTANEGYTITRCVFIQQGKNQSVTISEAPFELDFEEYVCLENTSMDGVTSIEVYGTAPAAAGPEVTWDATTKQATFLMPVYDVELQVEYYPGMLTFAPNAIEGGTVEVVGLTGDALPAGFEKDAEGNIYVAQGTTFTVKATPEEGYHFVCWSDDETNTDPEREITMPADGSDLSLTATFAENEYDITFAEGTNPDPENPEWTAAPNPAKTKQTVTVTYTGSKKVIGVKAEKKAATPTLKDALADGATVVINYTWDDTYLTTFTYTNNGGTFTGNVTGIEAGYFNNGMSMDGTTLKFTASNKDMSEANVSIEFDTDTNEYYFANKGSYFTSFTISVNGTDLTSQLAEVK